MDIKYHYFLFFCMTLSIVGTVAHMWTRLIEVERRLDDNDFEQCLITLRNASTRRTKDEE